MGISYDFKNCKPEIQCTGKPKVAFVCVHNSCRSQIAEALGGKLASDVLPVDRDYSKFFSFDLLPKKITKIGKESGK